MRHRVTGLNPSSYAVFSGSVVAYEKDPVGTAVRHVYGIVDTSISDEFHDSVRHAVAVIEEAVEKYRWDAARFRLGETPSLLLSASDQSGIVVLLVLFVVGVVVA